TGSSSSGSTGSSSSGSTGSSSSGSTGKKIIIPSLGEQRTQVLIARWLRGGGYTPPTYQIL
ncbi:MAG: hypothetical protein HQL04_00020, partial [Nitrospirae bacterium]|nr:hypothetical protein [Nitrospirota bacterium]